MILNISLLTVLCVSGAGASSVVADEPLGPLARRGSDGKVALRLDAPTVRIGLSGNGRVVTLGSTGGLHVVDRDTGRDVWKRIHEGVLRVVLERTGRRDPPTVYRVQVASLTDKGEADDLARRLEVETGEVVDVVHYPDRDAWRVRVGHRTSREEIRRVEERLRDLGFAELWVVQEVSGDGPPPELRLVDEDYNDMPVATRALLVLPARADRPIEVGDVAYRGVVEILMTRSRALIAVNVLGREAYLRGVVPRELGPTVFPEIEALKAQAVAARTYVEANRGQFAEDGYDICDTPRCQVYGGLTAEHPMSDFAVEQTAGIIATYQGEPINALYTSTCGGHTEDLKNVFREMEGPYLKGVRCYPEADRLGEMRRTLRGAYSGPPVVLATGERIDEGLAVLEVLGVLEVRETEGDWLAVPPTAEDVGRWVLATLEAVGKTPPEGFDAAREIATPSDLAVHLVEALGWQERAERLIHADDIPSLLTPTVLEATPPDHRPVLAYMIKEGILPRIRRGGGGESSSPITRALVARSLAAIVSRYEADVFTPAKFMGFHGEEMRIRTDGEISGYPLASRLHLIVRDPTGGTAVSENPIQHGDNIAYHLSEDGKIDYLSTQANQRGASDDRYSGVYVWETRIPRRELEEKIKERVSIGTLVDLRPGRRGVSGRLIDLTVVGTAGRFEFHGFSIERLLGLRESLFLIDRQYDDKGRIETFVFTGKGWGHGVGLCQVGAYGMALRGRSYEEILHHYYSDVTLQRR